MAQVQAVDRGRGHVLIQNPPIARLLFQSTLASWLWLVVRVYVGWNFLDAGWRTLESPEWARGGGAGLQLLSGGHDVGWFGSAMLGAELAVGLAAAGGLLLNAGLTLAGTLGPNPVLSGLGILLVLAWKNAGYIGFDGYLLPLLGAAWQRAPWAPGRPLLFAAPAVR